MKRRIVILIPVLIVIVYIVSIKFLTSEKYSISYIQKCLNNRHNMNFQYIESLESDESNRYFYLFSTTDDKRLRFKVKYWIGAEITPWGEQPLIQTKHVVDEFPKAIREYAVSQSPYKEYDITDIPLEEVAKNISSLVRDVEAAIDEYGVSSETSDINIIIIYNDIKYEMTFGRQTEGSIGDAITNTIYQ